MQVEVLDQLTDYDFGHTLSVVKAGEMFDFLDTPKNQVVLTDTGRSLLQADMNARKVIFANALKTLPTFRFVLHILEESPTHSLPADVIQEELAIRLTTEDVEKLFDTLVAWARFAELFTYSTDTGELRLQDIPASIPQ